MDYGVHPLATLEAAAAMAVLFAPLCVAHLQERCAAILPYLALPPGWRFLIAPGHEDLWYDADLLRAR
jgi:hypothetical protein